MDDITRLLARAGSANMLFRESTCPCNNRLPSALHDCMLEGPQHHTCLQPAPYACSAIMMCQLPH